MTQVRTPLVLLSLTAGVTVDFTTQPYARKVIDPSTGTATPLSKIDFATLTQQDARDIIAQLQVQGPAPGLTFAAEPP